MKSNIHPQWNNDAQVSCVCGNTFATGSTKDQIQVEICAKCHPFFTGEMKFVDTQGRVDKFMKKREASAAKKAELDAKAAEKRLLEDQESNKDIVETEKSYRQILAQTQSEMKKNQAAVKAAAKDAA